MIKANLTTMVASGARIVLGTDAGIRATYGFGWADHHELLSVRESRDDAGAGDRAGDLDAAEALGLKDVGTLAAGKNADFIVLNANPLDDINNTRQIASVYLRRREARSRSDARQVEEGRRDPVGSLRSHGRVTRMGGAVFLPRKS